MIPHYSKIHNRFKLNGLHFDQSALQQVAYSYVKEGLDFERQIGDFLLDWLNEKSFVAVKTSGSTGIPKSITLQKQSMVNSAIATGDYFGLQPGDTALHCLPSHFIAGKMMLVRAMILGLEIETIEPTSQPVFDYDKHYDFCAMIPLQLSKTISYVQNIKTIIVGGAKVSNELKRQIAELPNAIFETYGMTETITHIAVRQLNSVHSKQQLEPFFKTLPKVSISQDNRECLVIAAPHLIEDKVITNDVVALHSDSEFELLGRFDNCINSGGVKIYPETIEAQLEDKIQCNYIITSKPDQQLGERLVLVLEAENNELPKSIFDHLEKHHRPKEIICIPNFNYTKSGKIQREKTREFIL